MRSSPPTLTPPGWGDVTLDPSLALVSLREPADLVSLPVLLAPLGVALAPGDRVAQHPQHLWVTGAALPDDLAGLLSAVLPVDRIWPVYDAGAGRVAVSPDVLLVGHAFDVEGLVDAAASLGLRLDEDRSRYLGTYSLFVVEDGDAWTARDRLVERFPGADVRLDVALMESPVTGVPNDPLFPTQWNMTRIGMPAAWDVGTGSASVVVAIVEQDAVAAHPDLVLAAAPVDPLYGSPVVGDHATSCAGIAAAVAGNGTGVAGVATGCRILSACSSKWTDAGLAAAVRYAVAQGARVVSMSFAFGAGPNPPGFPLLEAALQDAAAQNVVLCGGSGNYDQPFVAHPAASTACIAVGGSDQQDRRATNDPAPGYDGSHYGPELDVVAPSVDSPTTKWVAGQPAYGPFWGTSCATPHVAGVAALLLSRYPSLSAAQVRSIVERTAVKPAGVAFADDPAYPNGTRNPELGYGRVDAFQALDFADVMIRDFPGDTGVEPSAPPNGAFWERCDIVVQPAYLPLLVFNPDPVAASRLVRGADNRIHVRVRNAGPATARNVRVDVRVAAYAGTGFLYPGDWTAVDARHLVPATEVATVAALDPGHEAMTTFLLTAAQVADIDSWSGSGMHPCVLAVVTADNDYAFASAVTADDRVVVRRNNVAMRNVTVVNLLGLGPLPLLVGSVFGDPGLTRVVIDRSELPADAELRVDMAPDAPVVGDTIRSLAVRDLTAILDLDIGRGALVPLTARLRLPSGVAPDVPAVVRITQQDADGTVVGGVTVVAVADEPAAEPEPVADALHVRMADLVVERTVREPLLRRIPRIDPGER